jgi:hypothetical protein
MTPIASAMQVPTIEGGKHEALPPLRTLAPPQNRGALGSPRSRVFEGNVVATVLDPELRMWSPELAKVEGEAEGVPEVQGNMGV